MRCQSCGGDCTDILVGLMKELGIPKRCEMSRFRNPRMSRLVWLVANYCATFAQLNPLTKRKISLIV